MYCICVKLLIKYPDKWESNKIPKEEFGKSIYLDQPLEVVLIKKSTTEPTTFNPRRLCVVVRMK